MSKIVDVIEGLKNMLSLTPASSDDVDDIQLELGLRLSEEYKEYLLKYGAIMADDIELTGFAKAEIRNVEKVTQREWKANNKIKHNLYVIENMGIDGIIIWQDEDGKIYESTPNSDAKQIADSLAEYLESK